MIRCAVTDLFEFFFLIIGATGISFGAYALHMMGACGEECHWNIEQVRGLGFRARSAPPAITGKE